MDAKVASEYILEYSVFQSFSLTPKYDYLSTF